MEFLAEFEVQIPHGAAASEVEDRQSAEASAAARLVADGHLVRLWKPSAGPAEGSVLGLYRADSQAELDDLLRALPLYDWMHVTVTPLAVHPNDPGSQVAVEPVATSRT